MKPTPHKPATGRLHRSRSPLAACTPLKVDAPAATVSTDTAERERTLYLRDGAASCIYCVLPSSPSFIPLVWSPQPPAMRPAGRLNREASAMPEAAGIEVALRES